MPGDIVFRYSQTAWLDSLPAYNLGAGEDGIGTSSLLELSRKIIESDSYFFLGYPFPQSNQPVPVGAAAPNNIGAFGSIQGNISLEPDTYVVSMGVFSLLQPNSAGFKISIYDKGAKTYLVDKGFAFYHTIGSGGDTDFAAGTQDVPFGPWKFLSPFIVTHPGILQVEITNLNNNADYVQIMLGCAVPVRRTSTNTQVVRNG